MKVKCIFNKGAQLGDSCHLLGSPQSTANLTVGREYTVVAMVLWESSIYFLVSDDHHSPFWYTNELFAKNDLRLPSDWFFATNPFPREPSVKAIWGYELLVLDWNHYYGLSEEDSTALEIFKNELELLEKPEQL